MNNDMKHLRKAAFAVGFGVTFGKIIGEYAGASVGGMITDATKYLAKKGNKTAQEICDKANVKYNAKKES